MNNDSGRFPQLSRQSGSGIVLALISGQIPEATFNPDLRANMGAAGLAAIGSGLHLEGIMPPPFNLIISNVPGPRETRYFGGARMLETYPVSGIAPMSALNVTVYSYDGELSFGLVGGRRAMPHLHDLKLCIDEVYKECHEKLLGAA